MKTNIPSDPLSEARAGRSRRSAGLGSTGAACLAFLFSVLAGVAAAAAVASHDVPLMLGGL